MEPLTRERAVELAREVVAEVGADFVYKSPDASPGGFYVHPGDKPGCLVGHVLLRHGVPVETLKQYNDLGVFLLHGETSLLSDGASAFLEEAQDLQDNGKPWGRAVADATLASVPDEEDDDA